MDAARFTNPVEVVVLVVVSKVLGVTATSAFGTNSLAKRIASSLERGMVLEVGIDV